MKFTPGEINIVCSNVERSLAFYRDVLGFSVTTDDDGFYHLLCGNQQYLLLGIAKSVAPVQPYGAATQFSLDLMVDDLQAAAAHFTNHGVTFAELYQPGEPFFVIRDPDGLPWEIIASE